MTMPHIRRAAVLFGRALLLRCPNCGKGRMFDRWLTIRSACPVCRLRFERGEQGYVVGAYMFNLIAAELIFAGIFLGIVVATWPSPPWEVLQYGGALFMVAAPFLFYPFAKAIFLAFDLTFRPPRPEDFS